jgi:predicted ATP-grasp superfamily ATP-dependent carboligase
VKLVDVGTPVLVWGFHHGSLGIARSLGRLGVSVHAVEANSNAVALSSRYCRSSRTWNISAAPAHQTLEFLRAYAADIGGQAVLIATSDDTAIFMAQHAAELASCFLFPRMPTETVRALSNKKNLHELARTLGVPTAETFFPESTEEAKAFAATLEFPVMVKGIDGLRLERRTGKKMVIVNSPSELLLAYRELQDPLAPNLMLQEYIPGGDDTVWMFNGYFDHNSECRAAFTGKKLRQHPIHTGATSLGICLENPEVESLTTSFMHKIRYRGVLDIGWRFDARDGTYKLLDPNPRIGSTFRLFVGTEDMDVARYLYLDMTGQPLPVSRQREGRKWLVEDQDLESTLDYMREGSLRWRAWLRSLRGVEEMAWFATDDIMPFLKIARSIVRRILRKALTAILPRRRPTLDRRPSLTYMDSAARGAASGD